MHTGGKYEEAADRLVRSAAFFGIEVESVRRPDKGGWLANCVQKVDVMAERWAPGQPLLFLDADAVVHKDFRSLWPWTRQPDLASIQARRPHRYMNSSCVYWGPRRRAGRALKEWADRVARRRGKSEDFLLRLVRIEFEEEKNLRWRTWPPEFAVRCEWRSSRSIPLEDVVISFNERLHPRNPSRKRRVVDMPPLPWEKSE